MPQKNSCPLQAVLQAIAETLQREETKDDYALAI